MKRFLKNSLSVFLALTIIFSSAVVGLSELDFSGIFAVRAEANSSLAAVCCDEEFENSESLETDEGNNDNSDNPEISEEFTGSAELEWETNVPISSSKNGTYTVIILDNQPAHNIVNDDGDYLCTVGSPIEYVKDVGEKLIDQLDTGAYNNKIALVVADTSTKVLQGFTDDFSILESKVNSLSTGSLWPDFGSAFEKADALLGAITEEEVSKNIIFVSCGVSYGGNRSETGYYSKSDCGWRLHNTDKYLYQYANSTYEKTAALKSKYNIYTMGLFQKLNEQSSNASSLMQFGKKFLTDIQNAGFYDVDDVDDLYFVLFENLFDMVINGNNGITFSVYDKTACLSRASWDDGRLNFGVKSATLTSNGNTYTCSNGKQANKGFVSYDELSGDVKISKTGYYDYIIPAEVISNMKTLKNTSLNVYLTADRKDGRPYISTVFGRENDEDCENEYLELQSNSLDILCNKTYDVIVTADLKGETSAMYYLSQDMNNRVPSVNGVFDGEVLYEEFEINQPIYAYAVTRSGRVTEPVAIDMSKIVYSKIATSFLDSPTLNLLGSDMAKITISDKVPLIGGAEVSMGFLEFPIGVEVEGNRVRVSLGRDFFTASKQTTTSTNKKTKVEKEKEWISFKKCCKEIAKEMESGKKLKDKYKAFEKAQKQRGFGYDHLKKNRKKIRNIGFDASYMGYIEGYTDGNYFIFTEFSGSVAAEFIAKYTLNTSIGPVPAYFYVQGGAELGVELERARALPDENIPLTFEAKLEATPKLQLGGGVGTKGILSGGIYGKAELNAIYEIIDRHLSMVLNGSVGVEGEFLIFSGNLDLLSGSVNILDEYFGSRRADLAGFASSVYSDMSDFMYADTQNVQYTLASRDYADYTSPWLGYINSGDDIFSGMQSPVYSPGTGFEDNVTELQTSVYKNSQTQLVQFGDKIMLAYIEDCSERDTYNRYRLMYTVYDPATNVWTQPKAVYDTSTEGSQNMDASPYLASDGTNVYIAWQRVNTTVVDSTEDELYNAMNNMEIYSAKYDASSDSFVNVTQHTDNSTYDYSPYVTVENGSATVYWVNAESTDFAVGEMSIHSSADPENTLVKDNLNYIMSIEATADEIAYAMDEQGDVSTVDDVRLFIGDDKIGEDVSEDTAIVTNFTYGDFNAEERLFYTDGRTVYYVADGESIEAFSDNDGIADTLFVTNLNGNPAIIYSQITDMGSELRISTFENDEWSKPVFLTEIGCLLSNVSVVSVAGKVYTVFNRTQTTEVIEPDDTYLEYGQTDLCMLKSEGYYDLVISNIGYEESDVVIGSATPFIVVMENKGTETINSVEFTVTDTLGNSSVITKEVNLAPGAIESVELEYVPQGIYSACDLTVAATIVGKTDVDTSNNTASEKIGRTDILVGTVTAERVGDVFVLMGEIFNDSVFDAENVMVKFSSGTFEKYVPVGTIESKNSSCIDIVLSKEEFSFDENDICVITVSVSTESEELALENNQNTVTIGNTEKLEEHEHNYVNNICDNCGMNAFIYEVEDDSVVITGYTGNDTDLIIPETISEMDVVAIADGAFMNYSNLTSVTINDNITSIGEGAFFGCTYLVSINVDENNSYYSSEDGVLFTKDKTSLIQFPESKADEEYEIPDTVTTICESAFKRCTNLVSVTMGNNVTNIGESAFEECDRLTAITIPDSVTQIGNYAFKYCSKLAEVNLPNSAFSIGKYAFESTGITELTLPENVVSVGICAFANCKSLQKLNYNASNCTLSISNFFVALTNHPFKNTSALTEVTIGENVESIPAFMFYARDSITSVYITNLEKWCCIDFKGIYANPLNVAEHFYLNDKLITKIVIPENTETINDYAFYNFKGFDSVSIPESVTVIGDSAFEACNNLKYIFYVGSESEWADISLGTDNTPFIDYPIHYNATDHSYEYVTDIEPTCTLEGTKHQECLVCRYSLAPEVISATGHNYSTHWTIDVAATCTEPGTKSHHCIGCGDKKDVTEIKAKGHVYPTRWTIDVAPTCETEGSKSHHCMNCDNKTDITVIAAANHNYVLVDTLSAHPHTYTYACSYCADEITEDSVSEICIVCIYGTDTPIKETENTEIDFSRLTISTDTTNCDDITDILEVSENVTFDITASCVAGDTELYGTGTVIRVYDGDTYIGAFTLVVNGDTNGDSVCDVLDAAQVLRVSNGFGTFEEDYYSMAADSNSDGEVDINDYQSIVNKAVV